MKELEKKDLLKKFLEKRIEENKNLFPFEELEIIKKNPTLIKKIYILGIKDINNVIKNKSN